MSYEVIIMTIYLFVFIKPEFSMICFLKNGGLLLACGLPLSISFDPSSSKVWTPLV